MNDPVDFVIDVSDYAESPIKFISDNTVRLRLENTDENRRFLQALIDHKQTASYNGCIVMVSVADVRKAYLYEAILTEHHDPLTPDLAALVFTLHCAKIEPRVK